MVIALLAIPGVDIIVLVVFPVFVLGRERWVTRQPGVWTRFPGNSDRLKLSMRDG